jgi:fermentation-respiration switch protein FrsA (DUF1100 family)
VAFHEPRISLCFLRLVYNERVTTSPLLLRLRKLGLFALRTTVFVYCLVLLLLLLLENTLLYPAPKYPEGDWTASYLPHEDVEFQSADGTKLHGWFVEHPNPRAVLLYCHGNGDCVAYLGSYLRELRDRHSVTVFAFDYRGYGKSEGSPSETGILADGDAAQNWLAKQVGKQPADIVLMGRSLGGCVVVDLAARNGARGLILQNTTTSMPDAAARIYWFLPVRLLMKNRYDSLSKIGRYAGPLLLSHGTTDTLIPFELGKKLFDAAPSLTKQFFPIEGAGHNDPEPPAYDVALEAFLDSLP